MTDAVKNGDGRIGLRLLALALFAASVLVIEVMTPDGPYTAVAVNFSLSLFGSTTMTARFPLSS